MTNTRRYLTATLLLSTAISMTTAAYAQQLNKYTTDEIVVTATKRSENLQDVPLSMTAFSEVKLEQLRPDDLSDLATHVPNMYLPPANESGSQIITLRGLGAGITRSGARSVGVYIDGVYSSATNLTNLPVSDLAGLEVLKGPQGTLFGRDTIGGAINVTTRKPGNEFGGFVEGEIGNYGRTVLSAGVDVPLAKDKLFFRLSGKKLNYGGHIDNLFDGEKADGLDQFSARAQLYFTPNDQFDARVIYSHATRDDNTTTGENAGGTFADQIPYQVNINVRENFKQNSDSISLNMNYELGSGHTLTSITGWAKSSDVSRVDRDLTPEQISEQSILYDVEDFNQEFRISSPDSDKFDYILGLYYLDSRTVNRDTYPVFGPAWASRLPFPFPGYPPLVDSLDGQQRDYTTKALAGYVHSNYHFNEKFSVFGGLRYISDKKDVKLDVFGELFTAFGFRAPAESVEAHDKEISWTGGARYALSDAVKTYASVSTGFRSSAVKDDFVTANDLALANGYIADPEFVTNYEIGIKIRSDNGRFSLNGALFYMDYKDIQVSVPDALLGFVPALENAEKAHISGLEIDATFAVTDSLTLSGSAGLLKTKYDMFSQRLDLEGEGFGTAPEWTLDAAIDYHTPLANLGELLFHVDATTITTPDDFSPNRTQLTIKGFSTLNGFVALDSADNSWRLSLWAKNILDQDNTTSTTLWGSGLGENQHNVLVYQPPRTFGATLRYNFD